MTDTNRWSLGLEGKIAVVTGGNGILGTAVCRQLLEAGAVVCSLDLTTSTPDQSLTENTSFHTFDCDVSNEDEVVKVISEIEHVLGPISALHNNAATKTSELTKFFASVNDYDSQTWEEVMRTNLYGMFVVARTVGFRMAQRNSGSIVQTSSIYGAVMGPDQRIYAGSNYLGQEISTPISYTASKAGVHGITNHLATFWGTSGVRVNTVSPGGISSGQNGVFEDSYSRRVPLGRMADSSEVASAVVFLMSTRASYITGQNLFVDGGLSSW